MAVSYTFTTLDDTGYSGVNELLGINNQGEVVGFGAGASGLPTAYALKLPYGQFGIAQYVNVNGTYNGIGAQTMAYGINDGGDVVGAGIATLGGSAAGLIHMGSGVATVGGTTAVLGVNDASIGAGFVDNGGTDSAVTISASGTKVTPLTVPGLRGFTATEATGVNNLNVISGFGTVKGSGTVTSVTEGFIYDTISNQAITLTGPAGATFTEALGLNDLGQVVGEYKDASGATHGFLYTFTPGAVTVPGTYTTIDDPQATAGTVVNGINDLGQFVGYYIEGSTTHGMLGVASGQFAQLDAPLNGNTYDLGAGMSGIGVGGPNAVSLIDPGVGNASFIANTGNDTIAVYGAADTVIGSTGNTTINATAAGDLLYLGSGTNKAAAAGSALIVGTTGTDNIDAAGGGAVFVGTGASTVAGGDTGATPLTIVGNAGATLAILGQTAGNVFVGGSGSTTVIGGAGQSTIVGGSGPTTVVAGGGGGVVFGGSASGYYQTSNASNVIATTFVLTQGNSTVSANTNAAIFLYGSGNNLVLENAGVSGDNVTLVATGSSGQNNFVIGNVNNQLYEGPTATSVFVNGGSASLDSLVGGGGADTYVFTKQSAGTIDIFNFRPGTDQVDLSGFSATDIKNVTGSATIKPDGSTTYSIGSAKVVFIGVHPPTGSFV